MTVGERRTPGLRWDSCIEQSHKGSKRAIIEKERRAENKKKRASCGGKKDSKNRNSNSYSFGEKERGT